MTVQSVNFSESGRKSLLVVCDCSEMHRVRWDMKERVEMLCGTTDLVPQWCFDPVSICNVDKFASGQFGRSDNE
jgi:hypothetical protein